MPENLWNPAYEKYRLSSFLKTIRSQKEFIPFALSVFMKQKFIHRACQNFI